MKKIAIIGAGISGLVCGWKLNELRKKNGVGADIAIYDSSSRAGGSIQTEVRDGFVLEKGPDSFISEKPWVLNLCADLGIDSEIIDTQPHHRKVLVVKNNRLLPLPEGFYLVAPTQWPALAATPLFSTMGKIRMASEMFIPRRSKNSDESIASFIRRRFGKEALERLGQPMIAGIHSGDPERLSLKAAMPRLAELEKSHGSVIRGLIRSKKRDRSLHRVSGPRYSLFLSFRNGMETLTRSLIERLPEECFHLGARVSVEGRDDASGKWILSDGQGKRELFDAVCLSTNAGHASRMIRDVDSALADSLAGLAFESVATLNLAYARSQISHPLDGFGFVAPAVERKSLLACTFASQKYQNRSPEGFVLLRAFVGGAFGKDYFSMDDADLEKAVTGDLKKLLGIDGEPRLVRLSRHRDALPQYAVDHQRWVSEVEGMVARHPGLYLTGASYRGTGITNCVKDAENQAEKMYAEMCDGGH